MRNRVGQWRQASCILVNYGNTRRMLEDELCERREELCRGKCDAQRVKCAFERCFSLVRGLCGWERFFRGELGIWSEV